MSTTLAKETLATIRRAWAPPPDLKTSKWAEQFRKVAASSPQPGSWRNSTTPYLVEIMDCDDDPEINTVAFMKPSRVGATEVFLNVIGLKTE